VPVKRSQFCPFGGEAVEVEQGSVVHNRVADFDDTAEPDHALVVAEIAQGPGGFHRALGAQYRRPETELSAEVCDLLGLMKEVPERDCSKPFAKTFS
jgi:hypothetical protein